MKKINRKAYFICSSVDVVEGFECKIMLNTEYTLWYNSDEMDISVSSMGQKKMLICGLFVDCRNGSLDNDSICSNLLNAYTRDEAALLEEAAFVAGHYFIVAIDGDHVNVLPDACSTYGVAYSVNKSKTYVSSNPKIIADYLGYTEDSQAVYMRKSTNVGEALPNDRTMYAEIHSLLPNHVLRVNTASTKRVYPSINDNYLDFEEVCKKSNDYLHHIIIGLANRRVLSLPLTGGIDSRTILAAMGPQCASKVKCYTYRHPRFTETTGDIQIPLRIATDLGLEYEQIPDLTAPSETLAYYENEIEHEPELFTPSLCYTYKQSDLAGRWFLSGGISPVGKSVYGNVLPEFLCRPSWLLVKAHNSSLEAYRELKKWFKDIKPFCKRANVSVYDMFYWEYRCGRWDQRTHLLIDAMVDMVSPYNCACLLQMWISIPRKVRQQKKIHLRVIELGWPELMKYPLNPDNSISSRIKKYPYLYWITSYMFWIKESIQRKTRG